MKKVLIESGLSKSDIDDIVFVGGSSRIDEMKERIKKLFNRDTINLDINPDEAVAYGAAMLAEDLSRGIREKNIKGKKLLIDVASGTIIDNNDHGKKVLVEGSLNATINNGFKVPVQGKGRKMLIKDILSQAIGIDVKYGDMSVVTPKGTKYNTPKVKDHYRPLEDDQTEISWRVYQGNEDRVEKCTFLYEYEMNNLPSRKATDYNFEVTMNINDSGLLDVDIKELHGIVSDAHFVVKVGVL